MESSDIRVREKDSVARSLGWFSLGLGAAQIVAPKALSRAVGAGDGGSAPALMRLIGLREIATGVGILVRPRPKAWMWGRVAGDAMDIALLGLTELRTPHRARTTFALANVAAVTVADVQEAKHLARWSGERRNGMLVRKTVTINRDRDEVERAWQSAPALRKKVDEAGAIVSFEPAPGGRGTELAVEFVYAPPAGDLGAVTQKLRGADLPTQLSDDLRRLKQLVETGEIARSDSTPEGHLLASQLKQRPARPLEEAVR